MENTTGNDPSSPKIPVFSSKKGIWTTNFFGSSLSNKKCVDKAHRRRVLLIWAYPVFTLPFIQLLLIPLRQIIPDVPVNNPSGIFETFLVWIMLIILLFIIMAMSIAFAIAVILIPLGLQKGFGYTRPVFIIANITFIIFAVVVAFGGGKIFGIELYAWPCICSGAYYASMSYLFLWGRYSDFDKKRNRSC